MDSSFFKHTHNRVIAVFCLALGASAAVLLYQDLQGLGQRGKGKPLGQLIRKQNFSRRKPADSLLWSRVQAGTPLYSQDSIQVGPSSLACIALGNEEQIEIGENSLVVIQKDKYLNIDFIRGSFLVRSLKGNQLIRVGSKGNKTITNLPIELVDPPPQAQYLVKENEKAPLQFQWKKPQAKADSNLILEISSGKSFPEETTIRSPLGPGATPKLRANIPEGRYFWRIRNEKAPLTETRELSVSEVHPLTPLFPAPSSELYSTGATRFEWSGGEAELPIDHFIELSQNPDFQGQSKKISVVDRLGVVLIRDLPEGNWYWRIKSKMGEVEVASNTVAFSLKPWSEMKILPRVPAEAEVLWPSEQVTLRWQDLEAGLIYEWEVQDQKKTRVTSGITRGSTALWKKPVPGKYRWRVTGRDNRHPDLVSPWIEFEVASKKPEVAVAPLVESPALEVITEPIAPPPPVEAVKPPPKIHKRAALPETPKKELASQEKHPEPPAEEAPFVPAPPQLQVPEPQATISLFTPEKEITFRWTANPKVKEFRLEVQRDGIDFFSENLSASEFKRTLSIGTYRWRVVPSREGQLWGESASTYREFRLSPERAPASEKVLIQTEDYEDLKNFCLLPDGTHDPLCDETDEE